MESTAFRHCFAAAVASGDPEAFSDLLADDVAWGGLEERGEPFCRSRHDVLAWYRRAAEAGARDHLVELADHGEHVFVHLAVRRRPDEEEAERFQVMTLVDDRIVEIRGYETRAEAFAFLADPGSRWHPAEGA